MTTTVAALIVDAATLIQDAINARWLQSEWLEWLNAGQREVVILKPEANTKNVAVLLTAGTTKQSLPADGVTLLRVSRNMGSNGLVAGDAVRIANRDVFDAASPTWHADANPLGTVKHYMFDPSDPRTYYVYPKAPTTALYVELVYSAVPVDATLAGTISLGDIYASALLDYMLYRAYSKDAEHVANATRAVAHYTAFANSLSAKSGSDQTHNPNQLIGGSNLKVPQ